MGRLAKLEEALAAAATADPAGQSPQVRRCPGKLAELEKAARNANELATSGIARFDGELSALRTDAGRLAQRLDTLKGEVEERLKGAAKAADLASLSTGLASLERDVQTFLKSEADRTASANANATQMLLALELANLKRAIDRGEGYAEELARAKKLGGFTLNFAALERYMQRGRGGAAGAGEVLPQGRQRHAGRRGRAGRRHADGPAAVGRALDRARAQGRPRRRRRQPRGHHRRAWRPR